MINIQKCTFVIVALQFIVLHFSSPSINVLNRTVNKLQKRIEMTPFKDFKQGDDGF